ncbi:hypothetical protein WAI453_009661 [Rhynchosporium graminicola]
MPSRHTVASVLCNPCEKTAALTSAMRCDVGKNLISSYDDRREVNVGFVYGVVFAGVMLCCLLRVIHSDTEVA